VGTKGGGVKIIGFLSRLFSVVDKAPKGILLYGTVQEVILVHHMLAGEQFAVRLVAPPPEFRVGCDLAIEFDLIEQESLEAALTQAGCLPGKMVSSRQMLPDVLKQASFVEIDGYLMCKAGNMKITIDQHDQRIVNVSGGGCPDIPYVAQQLRGVPLGEARSPVDLGNSLCTFMLQLAFDALKARVKAR
jgi:hypothetical protein